MALRHLDSIDMPEAASRSFATARTVSEGPVERSPLEPPDPFDPSTIRSRVVLTESGRAMNRFPIQLDKVQRPSLPEGILRRARLTDWLDANVHKRVVLVTAEAGYGKTTTLADWSQTTRVKTVWYRLDRDDGHWVTFLNHLVAAGREVSSGFAPISAARLGDMGTGGATREGVFGSFLLELQGLAAESPVAIVLDDFHLVDDSPDIKQLLPSLLTGMPDRMCLVLLSRRPPRIPLARLRSRDEVAQLRTSDLRFGLEETEYLFRRTYNRPLEQDVLGELNERTEGWAASLKLVETALRGRTPAETRAFVRGLTSAHGDLYDYLAEEVVGELPQELQEFLMRTSILQVVNPELAALVGDVTLSEASALLGQTGEAGLLAPHAPTPGRYHPLVRAFLLNRLLRDEGLPRVAALHQGVARTMEGRDWRIAVHHYAETQDTASVHRVLFNAVPHIMGSGDFALAESYLDRFPPDDQRLESSIIASRMALHRGQLSKSLRLARAAIDGARYSGPEHIPLPFAMANLLAIEYLAGNVDTSIELATAINAQDSAAEIAEIARAFLAVNRATLDLNLDDFVADLTPLAERHRSMGLDRYYGITSLNLAFAERARGRPVAVLRAADEAIDALERTDSTWEIPSARCIRAWALLHLGRVDEAEVELETALRSSSAPTKAEVHREIGEVIGMYLDPVRAQSHLGEALRLEQEAAAGALTPDLEVIYLSLAQNLVRLGEFDEAEHFLRMTTPDRVTPECAHRARYLTVDAELAAARRSVDADASARRAINYAAAQGARLYERMAECVLATLLPADQLSTQIAAVALEDSAYLTVEAGLLAQRLGDLGDRALDYLVVEATARPAGWRTPLRAAVRSGSGKTTARAARLIEAIGEREDIKLLRVTARRARREPALDGAGLGLARRLAKPVFVEDLGRVTIRVGQETVPPARIRRKPLALLCYVLTTPSMSASRDQVLEALWPDVEPDAAVNSLNQTTYFLRRVLEPEYDEDTSPGYVHHDSEVIWLDADLVSSRSRWCQGLIAALGDRFDLDGVRQLADEYRGPFALDFIYEDWAAPYRSTLHASFLELVEKALTFGLASGHYTEAIAVARRALSIDAEADQVELALLHLLQKSGAHAAAAEQYGHYASFLQTSLGVDAPRLDELLAAEDT